MDSPAAIQTFDLTRKFGEMTALDHLNLTVEGRKIFGLLGPNGAGKSTAIKMLTTLLEPSSGSAKVAGFDIVKDPTLVRAHIGYVPQMVSADGALTGRWEASLYRANHRYAKGVLCKGQMPLLIFFKDAVLYELIDPEMDDTLGFHAKEIDHLNIGRHATLFPEEGGDDPGYALEGSFLFHGHSI
jgi:hypothetical protein